MLADSDMRENVINRLKRIEGQVRGIQRLIDEGANCKKVASQVKAAHTALGAVGKLILACYLAESLTADPDSGKEAIDMLVKF
jgi:CsoR family transcriptional regulator, copper-sensing transcriptional repressor